jgi:hypothetical protein
MNYDDGRDAQGRPVFGTHGLGVGNPTSRAAEAFRNRGAEIINDNTPLPELPDPAVHIPQEGYGGSGYPAPPPFHPSVGKRRQDATDHFPISPSNTTPAASSQSSAAFSSETLQEKTGG